VKIPPKDDTNIFELTPKRIESLLKFANLKHNDVFYDLGSGRGEIVRTAFRKFNVKKSIGIELTKSLYQTSIKKTIKEFHKNPIGKEIEFWYGDYASNDDNYYTYDLTNATVIFNSLDPTKDEEKFYKTQFPKKQIKIIKKDMPLIGYLPEKINSNDNKIWFYLIKTPLSRKTKSKKKWLMSVMNDYSATEKMFFDKIKNQWVKRGITENEVKSDIKELKKLFYSELTKN